MSDMRFSGITLPPWSLNGALVFDELLELLEVGMTK